MKAILLLEDDESLNRGISLKLSKEGYQVLSAYTMREAKSMFEKEAIDLVISDITLPDGNGLDFGRAVREKSDVHLIYLTAMDQEIDIDTPKGNKKRITDRQNPVYKLIRVDI